MRRSFLFAVSLVVMFSVVTGCSSSDEDEVRDYSTLMSQKPLWSIEGHDFGYLNYTATKTTKGDTWLWHDNLGRLSTIMLFIPASMDISVLYHNPSSVEQLNGMYYQLGSDNELRCEESSEIHEGEQTEFNTSGMSYGFEQYSQYYKGVKVYQKGFSVNYYITPQGKRLAYASGQVLTGLNVDVKPEIPAEVAKQIFASRLGEETTSYWEAELLVREFILDKDGENVPDERLVWHVKGSDLQEIDPTIYLWKSSFLYDGPIRHEAQIDAHTGRLLVEGHTLSF